MVRALHANMARLARLAVTPGPAKDVIGRHTEADVRRLLADLDPPSDRAVADLAHQLNTGVLKGILHAASGGTEPEENEEEEEAMPEGPLRDFLPISGETAVGALVAVPALSKDAQQQAVLHHADPAEQETLRGAVQELAKAMDKAVESRCHIEGIALKCNAVIDAANANFLPVYDAVWNRIPQGDQAGCDEYNAVVNDLVFPAASADQKAGDPVKLLLHAAQVKSDYDTIVGDIVDSVGKDAKASIPSVRYVMCVW